MEWISVKDRMPDVGVDVLILNNYKKTGNYSSVTIGHLRKAKGESYKYWEWIAYITRNDYLRVDVICPGSEYVTHWMPLPEIPEVH